MKFSQFKKDVENIAQRLNIPVDDLDLEISFDPINTNPEDGIRYFGEILELMENQNSAMILCAGNPNTFLYSFEFHDPKIEKPTTTGNYLVITSLGLEILRSEETFLEYSNGEIADWDEIIYWAKIPPTNPKNNE